MNKMEIWSPRYKDRKVLVAKYKVVSGDNYIKFIKAKHLEGKLFKMRGEEIKKYPIGNNGTIDCYEVPFDDFEVINE